MEGKCYENKKKKSEAKEQGVRKGSERTERVVGTPSRRSHCTKEVQLVQRLEVREPAQCFLGEEQSSEGPAGARALGGFRRQVFGPSA